MLSQAEIDALLKGAIEIENRESDGGNVNLAEMIGAETFEMPSLGEVSSDKNQKVVAYNFWSPDRFSKEQMRAVELVHEDLVERLTTSLPTFLRTNVKPKLVHTEQGRFHEFLKDLPANTLFHMITLSPLPNQTVLTISPNVAYIILEQLLGGKVERRLKERPLTDIDQSLLRNVVENMLNDLKASWAKVTSIEPSLEDSTVNEHWVQMFLGNERVMLILFELTVQNVTGSMNIYIPFSTLKPIADKLNPHVFITGRKENQQDPVAREMVMDSLKQVEIPIHVDLGKTRLTLKEIVNLQKDQVLVLDTHVGDDLTIYVAKEKKFKGKVGKQGKKIAVQITSKIDLSIEQQS